MFGGCHPFFGVVKTPIVRFGEDDKYTGGEHKLPLVYGEMLLQVTRDYSGLPDCRTLTLSEIRFFYPLATP